ncbi:chemosensory receptor a [Plakobranchus ocellatus]|uniref:Chemosensory receptor a n=1 Tax=Plakobranchus ocellatus TaxID=259542 RepID=A0AAV4CZV3_9GAST|nr:chemosensory receptor a [Plakobranchus ocellatus]
MDQNITNYTNLSGSADAAATVTGVEQLDHILIYPILCILIFGPLGIATNITNIAIFIKMGLQETTTISMLALAVCDLICCILATWTYVCFVPAFRDSPYLSFRPEEVASETGIIFRPYLTRTGALITAFITLERCLCVVLPMRVKNIITVRVTRIAMITIYVITASPYIVHIFQSKLDWKFYPHLNKTLVGRVHVKNPTAYAVIEINSYICGFFYLLFASGIIFLCTIFLAVTLFRTSRWRASMRKQTENSSSGKSGDMKTGGTRKEMRLIKMVVIIASLFIVCNTPGTVVIFITAVTPEYLQTIQYLPSTVLLKSCIFASEVINQSVNFFVYYTIGTKFKLVFRQMIGFKMKNASS